MTDLAKFMRSKSPDVVHSVQHGFVASFNLPSPLLVVFASRPCGSWGPNFKTRDDHLDAEVAEASRL